MVAGLSLLSKYVIRYHGSHVFNPSNIGLVVTFVLLGSSRVEPLDFWWAPLNPAMLLAYAVILGGGLLITRRLKLLVLAASFWIVLASGLGVLAASGHCMTANWAFAPVCGVDYWRVIVGSPETMIFLFFMITDPKTVPAGRVGRVVFGALVAVASVLPWPRRATNSEPRSACWPGSSWCARRGPSWITGSRPVESRSAADAARLSGLVGPVRSRWPWPRSSLGPASSPPGHRLGPRRYRIRLRSWLGCRTRSTWRPCPSITVDEAGGRLGPDTRRVGHPAVLVTLAQNLEAENEALQRRDASILTAVDHGDRLAEMQGRLSATRASGTTVLEEYRFDAVHVSLLRPFGVQTGLSLGFASRGTMSMETYDANGRLGSSVPSPFAVTFVVRRATGARWLNVAVLGG